MPMARVESDSGVAVYPCCPQRRAPFLYVVTTSYYNNEHAERARPLQIFPQSSGPQLWCSHCCAAIASLSRSLSLDILPLVGSPSFASVRLRVCERSVIFHVCAGAVCCPTPSHTHTHMSADLRPTASSASTESALRLATSSARSSSSGEETPASLPPPPRSTTYVLDTYDAILTMDRRSV